jgi:methanogenic corrinoid protein MtbC1
MYNDMTLQRYLAALLDGNRHDARTVIEEVMQSGIPANTVYINIIWPIMVEIDNLARKETITPVQEHMATRINRTIVNQLQNKLPKKLSRNKKIAITCSEAEIQELGAQIMADLFESDGWDVKFIGGGLANDDILSFINDYAPNILLVYGTSPKQAPAIRKLIDTIKSVNAWPNMKIMLSGGLFNRAEGLWEEIGADIFAPTAEQAVQSASDIETNNSMIPCRTINKRKMSRKNNTVNA